MEKNYFSTIMQYRQLGNTGLKVGVIGLGCEYIMHSGEKNITSVVQEAVSSGINYIDLFAGTPYTREYFGNALRGIRNEVYLAGHLGAGDNAGQYMKIRDEKICKNFLRQFYEKVNCNYIDVLYLHNCDTSSDLDEIFTGWMYQYAVKLKRDGRVGHIGLASHNTKTALEAVKSGNIEVLMFPVNPLFNMLPFDIGDAKMRGRNASPMSEEEKKKYPSKEQLYKECKKRGVGIIAMKPYAAGNILKGCKEGHLKGLISLTPVQAISYTLSFEPVACPIPGVANVKELREALEYLSATRNERDYFTEINDSIVSNFAEQCMYCNHCQPCPQQIDIATVIKIKDIAVRSMTDEIMNQYKLLRVKPSSCIHCGECTKRCPFGIDPMESIRIANEIFSRTKNDK